MVPGSSATTGCHGDRRAHFSQQPRIRKFRMLKPDPDNWIIYLFISAFTLLLLYLLWPYLVAGIVTVCRYPGIHQQPAPSWQPKKLQEKVGRWRRL